MLSKCLLSLPLLLFNISDAIALAVAVPELTGLSLPSHTHHFLAPLSVWSSESPCLNSHQSL